MYNLAIQLAARIGLPPYIGEYIKCSCGVDEGEQDRNTIISIRKRTSDMWYLLTSYGTHTGSCDTNT